MLLCGLQSASDEIKFLLRGCDPLFSFLLKGMQDIDGYFEPDGIHRPIGISFLGRAGLRRGRGHGGPCGDPGIRGLECRNVTKNLTGNPEVDLFPGQGCFTGHQIGNNPRLSV